MSIPAGARVGLPPTAGRRWSPLGAARRRLLAAAAVGAGLLGVAWLAVARSSGALLYPDGYQYLLMARGIAEGARPVTRLGPGGDLFVPSVDAAAKPLYPLLVAIGHGVGGLSWIDSARVVSALAGALVVLLCGLLAARLTGSRLAGALAAAVCLASPSLAFWDGLTGPDPLAQALALGAALALVAGRAPLGGVLAAACIAARPEYAAIAIAAAMAGAASPQTRALAARASLFAAGALALILAVLRPPIAAPAPALVLVGAVGLASGAAALLIPGLPRRIALAAGGGLLAAGATALAVHGLTPGMRTWLDSDWPLAALALAGGAVALGSRRHRGSAFRVIVVMGMLGALYLVKNPTSDRYVAQLVPALALLVGLGVAAGGARWRAGAAGAAAIALLLVPALGTAPRPVGPDMFGVIARQLAGLEGGPLVTAASDAYGFLLPARTVRSLRPGERGLILLDGAQRAYQPEIGARGRIVARLSSGPGFLRPDGVLDEGPAIVVSGVAERRAVHGG